MKLDDEEICDLCYSDVVAGEHVQRGKVERLCSSCLDWSLYWDALTPQERRLEIESQDRYVTEQEAERRRYGP